MKVIDAKKIKNSASYAGSLGPDTTEGYNYETDDEYSPYYSPTETRKALLPTYTGPGGNYTEPSYLDGGSSGGFDFSGIATHNDPSGLSKTQQVHASSLSRTGSSSYGYRGSVQPIGQTTTSRTTYSGTQPSLNFPTLNLPKWGKEQDRAVRARSNKISGPDILAVKQALQQAAGKTYRNPMAASYIISRALQQGGLSMGQIRGRAESEAENAVRAEWADEQNRQMAEYQNKAAKATAEYDSLWKAYLSTATQTSTTKKIYSEGGQYFQGGASGGGGAGGTYQGKNPSGFRVTPGGVVKW